MLEFYIYLTHTHNIIIFITKDYHHHGGSAYTSNGRLDHELSRKDEEEVAQQAEIQPAAMSDKKGYEQAEEKRKSGLRKRYSVRSSIGGPSSGAI